MYRRLLAPMLLVFPLVLLAMFAFMKLSEPVETPPNPEEIKAKELAKVRTLLQQWEAMPADARKAAASQLISGLDYPIEDVLWETTWALGELGPSAVPVLAKTLDDPNASPSARGHVLWALGLVGPDARPTLPAVKKALTDPIPEVRAHAAFAVSQIDDQADGAVTVLIPLFADPAPEVTEAATQAVARYRDRAIPSLRQALTNPNATIRKQSVITLGLMGEHAGNAVGDLVAIVRDPNNELRAEAAEALGNIGAPALSSLTAALKDPSDTVRLQAADALGRIGRAAVATLVQALQDDNVNVRLQILNSLIPHTDDAVAGVIAATKDPATSVRDLAVQMLPLVREPKNRDAVVAPLVAALADSEASVRKHAAFALRRLQPPAEMVLPAIKPITQDPNAGVRYDAIGYLYSAGFGNRAVPFLALALKDPDDKVQTMAVKILEEMKADPVLLFDRVVPLLDEKDNEAARINALNVLWRSGPAAAAHLLAALQDPKPKVRQMAIWSLHQGTIEVGQIFPQLLPALKDSDVGVRGSAMAALARHGSAALPHLAEGLKDPEPSVRAQAATSLGHVQAKPADVLPLLEKALKEENEEVRVAAAAALEPVGPPGATLLLQAFQDKSEKVWKQALRSLIKMPGDNRILLPILIQATRHEDPNVRVGAVYALERFKGDAVKPLVQVLKTDKDANVQWAVVDVIDTIGIPAKAAFADLVDPALNHPVEKIRYGALVAMLKMQALDKYREALTLDRYKERISIVIPHLIRAVEDRRDAEWRYHAAVTLGVIGPAAKNAVPALTRALNDSDPRVREAAKEALTRINQ